MALQPGNWHALESDGGREFRWVENYACFSLPPARNHTACVEIELEAGPGMGRQNFELTVRGAAEEFVHHIQDRVRLTLTLPLSRDRQSDYTLIADGGGFPCPNDDRQINFRVFCLATPPDLVDLQSGLALLSGWAPFDRADEPPYRVAYSGAQVQVFSPRHHPVLCLDFDPGPLLSHAGLRIDLHDEDGNPVATTSVLSRQLIGLRLPFPEGAARTLSMHWEWIGRPHIPPPQLKFLSLRLN